MPHPDEGMLTYYLDVLAAGEVGQPSAAREAAQRREIEAHIESCGECRAQLEQQRRVRARAAEILGGAGPASLAAPPFAELRARAAARERRAGARRLSRWQQLGIAATLVLAVGAGWVARDVFTERTKPAGARDVGLAEAEPISAATPAGAMSPAAPSAAVGAGAQTRPDVAAPPPSLARAAAARTEADEQVGPVRREAAPARDSAPAVREVPKALAAAEPARAFPREGLRLEAVVVTGAEAPAQARPVLGDALGIGAAPPEWTVVSHERAFEYLDRAPATIADLPVVSYATGRVGAERAVRVVHALGPGETIELIQARRAPPADAQPAPAAPAGRYRAAEEGALTTMSVVWEGLVITARAPVPADSLRVLLQGIRSR